VVLLHSGMFKESYPGYPAERLGQNGPMTSSGAVLVDTVEDGVVRITLNRPDLLNAIDGSLLEGVDAALDAAFSGEHRVAILTGAGRGFCSGADLSGTGQPWTKPARAEF